MHFMKISLFWPMIYEYDPKCWGRIQIGDLLTKDENGTTFLSSLPGVFGTLIFILQKLEHVKFEKIYTDTKTDMIKKNDNFKV